MNRIRTLAAASAVYDGLVGIVMIAARPWFSRLFEVPPAAPPIHGDLNGILLLAIAAGYLIPHREPASRAGRAYLWVMGPLLKGAGAAAFVLDYVLRRSPRSSLLFAASDGILAVATLWALTTTVPPQPGTAVTASTNK